MVSKEVIEKYIGMMAEVAGLAELDISIPANVRTIVHDYLKLGKKVLEIDGIAESMDDVLCSLLVARRIDAVVYLDVLELMHSGNDVFAKNATPANS